MTQIFSEKIDDVIAAFDFDFTKNESDICADLIIEVDEHTEYYAHRFVLCRRSPAFHAIIKALPQRKFRLLCFF